MLRNIKEKLKIILRLLVQFCLPFLDGLFLLMIRAARKPSPSELLIVRVDGIGDFVLWLDAAKHLRTLYPPERYRITLLGNSLWTELAKHLPYFDEVWSLDKERFEFNPVYRFKMLGRVRKAGFDVVIHPTFSREFLFGDTFVRASNARVKVGFQGDHANIASFQKRISNRWYTRLAPSQPGKRTELERNAEFMRALGLSEFNAHVPDLSAVSPYLPESFPTENYYILFPGAGHAIRKWPLSFFAQLAERIHNATGWRGIVCGSPGDKRLGEIVSRLTPVPIENWAGRTTLRELTGIVQHARILIGNETSAIHIAAAVSTPSVCILGGGHFGRFLPYSMDSGSPNKRLPAPVYTKMDCFNCDWRCIYPLSGNGTVRCIDLVSIDAVWNEVDRILSSKGT